MNQETIIQRKIMLALSEAGCTIWRNEVAGAWVGKQLHKDRDQITLTSARMVVFGVGGKGGSDLVGIAPDGRFLAVEVKTAKGRPSHEQNTFIDAVNAAGGIGGIARSPDEALALLGKPPYSD